MQLDKKKLFFKTVDKIQNSIKDSYRKEFNKILLN